MVGLVIVTHSAALAHGVAETCRMMAKDARIATAGGMEDGGFGTSYARIVAAIDSVYGEDGVAILMDAGSSILTVETIVEEMGHRRLRMADCPVAEGALSPPSHRSAERISMRSYAVRRRRAPHRRLAIDITNTQCYNTIRMMLFEAG